jgi:hypothetical protein
MGSSVFSEPTFTVVLLGYSVDLSGMMELMVSHCSNVYSNVVSNVVSNVYSNVVSTVVSNVVSIVVSNVVSSVSLVFTFGDEGIMVTVSST